MASVTLEKLWKKYRDVEAVRGISLDIADGEFMSFLGPSGCGKSSTMRMIAGLEEITSGNIYFDGELVNKVRPRDRNVALAFETYALYPTLNVYENLAFPLRAARRSNADVDKRVREIAGILEITDLLDRMPARLSGGQQQSVGLARALTRAPRVFLMDEPISHLDAKLRHHMRGELKAMCAGKEATVIHVTHDSREAMALSDRVAVINKGRLMQIGSPDEIFHRPANEFVASFVGEPPMSFMDMEYGVEEGQPVFHIAGNDIRLPASPEVDVYVKDKGLPDTFRLGVRVTEVTVSLSADETHNVPGEVYVTETLGHRNLLTAKLGNNLVQVVTPPELTFKVKDTIWLDLSQDNLHVFADGLAIAHPRRRTS